MKILNFEFFPVDQESWVDFESMFEAKGSPHSCWCTVWRTIEKEQTKPSKVEKKLSMKKRVLEGIPIGILAYLGKEPVGWCSIAPRETYKKLGGDKTKENVWSIVCFFIKHPFRKKGIINRLVLEAILYAKNNGAKFVEGYPVDKNSPSYRFMGFKETFEKANFEFVKKVGKRRNLFILEVL